MKKIINKKTINKKIILPIILILLVLSIVLIFWTTSSNIKENINIEDGITKDEAIKIATNYLKEMKYDDTYIIDSARLMNEDDISYTIEFKRLQKWGQLTMPGEGWIKIDKETGNPEWIPLE